jgi:hypothetical protein
MSRLTIILTAAAASALATAAILALPALGDNGKSGEDSVASYATCLRSHGLDGAPSDSPMALKQWLGAKEQADPATVEKAIDACAPPDAKPKFAERRELSTADVAKLVACMRDNGLDAPSDPAALKRWLQQHESADRAGVEAVMRKCKMTLAPEAAKPVQPGGCGNDAAKPADPGAKLDQPAQPIDTGAKG